MAKFKVGDTITSIDTAYEGGSVEVIEKVGRRYLRVRLADRPNGPLFQVDLASSSRIILLGDRSDVVERLVKLRQEYERAADKHRTERRKAERQFERQWDTDHPYPPNAAGAYIEELRKESPADARP